ncbi:MAG TPA: aldo/keto reductase [Micromonosporaceae bacterium]|nr:aldo/keto reductase [Micromonosporaceae bacterium]
MPGSTGIEVSTLCLGTMMFGSVGGSGAGNPDHDACVEIVRAALDAGVNFIDTADMYSVGESEVIVGKALRGCRDDVVLATKGHFPLAGGPARSGNSRRWLLRAVEGSLRRLGTDWIDVYLVHRPDEATAVEETLSALSDLVRDGKIRAFGCSSFPAEQIVAARAMADRHHLPPFRVEQPPYSLLTRGVERAVLPICAELGMGVMTWSPLAFGFLSGRYSRTAADLTVGRPVLARERFDPSIPATEAKYTALAEFERLAGDLGRTLPELAIAFPAAHPAVTSVIIGPRTADQLHRTIDGASLLLSDEVLDRIDAIVPPGTDTFPADAAYTPPALTDLRRRRRPPDERAAGSTDVRI